MKLIFALVLLFVLVNSSTSQRSRRCGNNQRYRSGPTWDCDNTICRGYEPDCIDPLETERRCFCEEGMVMLRGNCVEGPCPNLDYNISD